MVAAFSSRFTRARFGRNRFGTGRLGGGDGGARLSIFGFQRPNYAPSVAWSDILTEDQAEAIDVTPWSIKNNDVSSIALANGLAVCNGGQTASRWVGPTSPAPLSAGDRVSVISHVSAVSGGSVSLTHTNGDAGITGSKAAPGRYASHFTVSADGPVQGRVVFPAGVSGSVDSIHMVNVTALLQRKWFIVLVVSQSNWVGHAAMLDPALDLPAYGCVVFPGGGNASRGWRVDGAGYGLPGICVEPVMHTTLNSGGGPNAALLRELRQFLPEDYTPVLVATGYNGGGFANGGVWSPTGSNRLAYDNFWRQSRKVWADAPAGSVMGGVMVCQGESDLGASQETEWASAADGAVALLNEIRAEPGWGETPIVINEIGMDDQQANVASMIALQKRLATGSGDPLEMTRCAYVPRPSGWALEADGVHYDQATNRARGYLAARALHDLIYAAPAVNAPAAAAPDAMAAPIVTSQGPNALQVALAAAPFDGGSAIVSYDARYSVDGVNWTFVAGISDPYVLTGLTADAAYSVQTRAVNAVGAGAWSASGLGRVDAAEIGPTQLGAVAAYGLYAGGSAAYQDATATAPALTGDPVAYLEDLSGNGHHAVSAADAARPVLNAGGYLVCDRVDDTLSITVPVGGWSGDMAFATTDGVAVYGVDIPGGSHDVVRRYQPGANVIGCAIFDRTLSAAEATALIGFYQSRGAGDFSAMGDFSNAWRSWDFLTRFPAIDTGAGAQFTHAWRNCWGLTSFPALDFSQAASLTSAWKNATALADFPANVFDACPGKTFSSFDNTALTQSSIDNILTSLVAAGQSDGQFSQSGGAAPSAVGEAAIDVLTARGWSVSVSGGYAPSGPSGTLTLTAPKYDVWDFDDQAVTVWNSDVAVATEAELEAAIAAAMGQGTAAAPQYHRIVWSGGAIDSPMNLTAAVPIPDKYGPHILVDGGAYTAVNAEIGVTSISNVKFVGFQFQHGSNWATDGFARNCVRFYGDGGGRRLAFSRNRAGEFWKGGGRNSFSRFLACGDSAHNWEVSATHNDLRDLFEGYELNPGKWSIQHTLATGLVDDFISSYGRGVGGEVYLHVVGNVVCDMHDAPTGDSGWHCDFIQCADNSDSAADSYHVQAQGNIYIGDAHQQYPTMASILQNQGGATDFTTDYSDNIFLCTGTRGFWLPNRQTSLHRNLHAWPPLGGAVPTSGTGWNGGPFKQRYRAGSTTTPSTPYGLDGDVDIGHYWAADTMANTDGWGAGTIVDPAQIIDHTAPLGGATSYDQRFPNMTGLTFNGATLIIDNGYASATRTLAGLRNWVSSAYQPNTTAHGSGWAANGFNDPAGWFV